MKEKERKAYALRLAIQLGCSGAHKMPDGSWHPCASHEELTQLSDAAESNDWMGQNTIGSLRARDRKARKFRVGAKTLNFPYSMVAGKAAVPGVSPRDNDPDVFVDPESARLRSRMLGCIGISRRISKSGRTVWMPCTNMSDYARLARTTALGRRGAAIQEDRRMRRTIRDEIRKNSRKR